jgi:hypothetical protein
MQSCDYPTVRRLIDDGERTLTVCSDLTFTNATADKTINMNMLLITNYHSALQLNNIGVSLLEKGRYKQAACVLKDALKGMKMLFKKKKAPRALHLERKLEQARMHNEINVSSTGESSTLTYSNSQIVLEEHGQVHCGSIHPVAIEISHDPSTFSTTGRDPQLEMAVILNNAGIAFFHVSNSICCTGSSSTSTSIQEQALSMMNLASSVMLDHFAICDDIKDEARLMSVALVVTGNTMNICRVSGRTSDAKDHSNKYQRMCLAIRRCGVAASTA